MYGMTESNPAISTLESSNALAGGVSHHLRQLTGTLGSWKSADYTNCDGGGVEASAKITVCRLLSRVYVSAL